MNEYLSPYNVGFGYALNGGPEGDRTLEPHGCEPCALPAELQAQIGTFHAEKVAKFGFLEYSIFREKSNKSDRKTGNWTSGRMCLAMDANRTLSQLSYRPLCRFWGRSLGPRYVALALPAELQAHITPLFFSGELYYSTENQKMQEIFSKIQSFLRSAEPVAVKPPVQALL